MQLAPWDAWIRCVLSALNTNVGRGRRQQLLFSELNGNYKLLAVDHVF